MSQRLLDPGQNPTAPCSVTVIGSEEAQNIVIVDGISTTALGTASNPFRVNPTGTTTQPISGTVAATQSGSWTVSIQEPLSIDDNGGSITVDGAVSVSGSVNVGNISGTINLPTGAATAALQLPDGHNVTVDNGSGINAVNIQDGGNSITIDGSVTVSGTVAVSSVGGTVAVSAAALPLPTGAATAALQTTGNSSLSSLDSKVTACDTGAVTIANLPNEGQQTMANSISVAIASNQSAVPISDNGGSITVDGTVAVSSIGGTVAISATSLPLPTGAATETTLSSINTKTPALGQTTMTGSSPVVIASNQTAIPINDNSGSITVDGAVSVSGTVNVGNISGTVSLPTGAATETTLSSISTKTPSLGQTTMAGSSPVTIASDQSTINVKGAFAVGAGADNPVRIGFTDFALGTVTSPDTIDFGGITYPLILLPDPDLNFLDYTPNGELRCHVYSPDNTETNARYALCDSNGVVAIDSKRQQTILFAAINASSSGDNTIVAADATKKIKVLSYAFVCSSTVNVKWKSGAGTDLSGAMPFIANTGIAPGVSSPSQGSLLETAVNQALILNLSGAVTVAGHMSYYLEA